MVATLTLATRVTTEQPPHFQLLSCGSALSSVADLWQQTGGEKLPQLSNCGYRRATTEQLRPREVGSADGADSAAPKGQIEANDAPADLGDGGSATGSGVFAGATEDDQLGLFPHHADTPKDQRSTR